MEAPTTTAPCWSLTTPLIAPVAPSYRATARPLAFPAPTCRPRITALKIEAVLRHMSVSPVRVSLWALLRARMVGGPKLARRIACFVRPGLDQREKLRGMNYIGRRQSSWDQLLLSAPETYYAWFLRA